MPIKVNNPLSPYGAAVSFQTRIDSFHDVQHQPVSNNDANMPWVAKDAHQHKIPKLLIAPAYRRPNAAFSSSLSHEHRNLLPILCVKISVGVRWQLNAKPISGKKPHQAPTVYTIITASLRFEGYAYVSPQFCNFTW